MRFVPLRHVRRDLQPGRDLLGLLELVTLLRRERPDLLHVNSSKAAALGRVAALAAGPRVRVFTVHGWAFKAYAGPAAALYRWADRLLAPLTTVTICVSETERAAGLAARTCRAERTVVIPNAIDVERAPRARLDGDPPRIVTVGRLAAPKDPLTLVRALPALGGRRYSLAFVGGGRDQPHVEEELRAHGLTERSHCSATATTFRRSWRAPTCSCSRADPRVRRSRSSRRWRPGCRWSPPTSAASPSWWPTAKRACSCRPGEPDALARALARLLDDGALRERMGAAGRARARDRFDLAELRAAHLELYAASSCSGMRRSAAGGRWPAAAAACRVRRRASP